MSHAKIPFEEGGAPTKCMRAHTLKAGLRSGTKLHVDEILTSFPKGYDKVAAKFQCCNYLHYRPLTAVKKVMASIDKDTTHFK
jgi:hypothetical protein